eukprot:430716-Amorphochlora_amoeboformis.AAC.1
MFSPCSLNLPELAQQITESSHRNLRRAILMFESTKRVRRSKGEKNERRKEQGGSEGEGVKEKKAKEKRVNERDII